MNSRSSRLKALSRLGLVAGTLYMTPTLLQLDNALASGAITLANDPVTVQECSDCHPAYAPRYLRAYAWQKIMGNLNNHFGEDISLDEATRLQIEEYLVYNGSRPRKVGLRITAKKWFVREHSARKIGSKMMKKAVSLSNCTACHNVRDSSKLVDRRPNP